MTRTALVTGGGGFVAGHLIPRLLAGGFNVRACGRRQRPAALPAEIEYVPVDLAENGSLEGLLAGVTHLFHLAGATSSLSDQEQMRRSNVIATDNLMATAATARVERALFVSSTSVYGEEVLLPQPLREDVEPHPSRGYGKTKWLAEQVVWRHAEKGLPVVVLRPVSIYGPAAVKLLASAILDAAIERFAGARTLPIFHRPVEQRLVHVADVAAACLHLIEHDRAVGRAFNLTLDDYPTSHDLAGMIGSELGLEVVRSEDAECGLPTEERRRTWGKMVAAGMREEILFTDQRFRLMGKANPNNRLSTEALRGTGFRLGETDLGAGISSMIAWYLERRWIL